MKKLEDLYGQKQGRAEKSVPFKEVADLIKRVRQERKKDASKRVNYASDTIIKLAEKMEDRWKEKAAPRSYAQAARMGGASETRGRTVEAPPAAHLKEERRIMVRLANREEVEVIKEQIKEEIAGRIQRIADEAQGKHKVIAV
jgi:hypothetical protein